MRKFLFLIMVMVLSVVSVSAQEPVTMRDSAPDGAQISLTQVLADLDWPVYATNAGDGSNRLFILDQTGQIHILVNDELISEPFLDITSLVTQAVRSSYSEQGLLGLAFHPNFAENGQFFVHYNRDGDGMTVIARYTVSADDPNRADPDSGEILLTHPQPYRNHNGGQIDFGPDGYLYIALGDGGSAGDPENNAQNPQTLLGNILRIDVDAEAPYGIPADNPALTDHPDLAPEIWAWGLRNPYRFSFDSATGDLYIADVGQNQWEEINFQPADSPGGINYGWRPWEGMHRYSTDEPDPGNTEMPVLEYSHQQGCSVTGGYVYRGDSIPSLDGVYVYGDYCSGQVFGGYRDMDGNWQSVTLMQTPYQVTGFAQDESGELYLIAYDGRLLRFGPA